MNTNDTPQGVPGTDPAQAAQNGAQAKTDPADFAKSAGLAAIRGACSGFFRAVGSWVREIGDNGGNDD
ncbi:hypothetical protein [Streptomyces olivochromogenes]|uniref:hypothetical protein n=1 Tax=Streptomyces olivochromogenes TaxID=1963 RepID=UPI001F2C6D3C|nr:hypothetical protein [Streptomyces olivochromogenes]MCF3136826.1 hypothetical protein [Streptomyces olivochromogenes]